MNQLVLPLHLEVKLDEKDIAFAFHHLVESIPDKEIHTQEAIFIDGTNIEANANKFTFVSKKAVDKHHARLIEKSNQLYNELLEQKIIPELTHDYFTATGFKSPPKGLKNTRSFVAVLNLEVNAAQADASVVASNCFSAP